MLSPGAALPTVATLDITAAEYHRIRDLLLEMTGIALGASRRTLVVARLGRRVRALGLQTFSEYCDHLATADPEGHERQELLNCLTTHETRFWREPHHFDFIRHTLVPAWQARATRGGSRRIRVWSAGCSTGEEPYSLAITLLEALGTPLRFDLAILATDIDTAVLETARRGVYPLARLGAQPQLRLRRFFLRGHGASVGQVRVRPEVRSLVTFRALNLAAARWPLRRSFDVICCRNVIIYFDRPTQERVCAHLLTQLAPGGHLLLGHSESLGGLRDLATPIGPTIYQANRDGSR